jgi:hypothetical protein
MPVDMMDNSHELPTYPQAQQQKKFYTFKIKKKILSLYISSVIFKPHAIPQGG